MCAAYGNQLFVQWIGNLSKFEEEEEERTEKKEGMAKAD